MKTLIFLLIAFSLYSADKGLVTHTKEGDFEKWLLDEVGITKVGDGEIALTYPSFYETWTTIRDLPEPLSDLQALVLNKRLYILGGLSKGNVSISAVYMANIQDDGNLSSFIRLAPLPKDLYKHTAFIWDNRLYVVGGSVYYKEKEIEQEKDHPSKNIYYAKMNKDGTIKEWQEVGSTPFSDGIFSHQTAIIDGWLYLIGGKEKKENNFTPTNKIYYALIDPLGEIKNWKESQKLLPQTPNGHIAISTNQRIYVIANDEVYTIKADENKGEIKEMTTTNISYTLQNGGGIIRGSSIYYFGGIIDGEGTSSAISARINPDGGITGFSPTISLPEITTNHSIARYKDFVYIIGGKDKEGNLKTTIYCTRLKKI
ncbi:MAG: hypothetical protein AB1595_01470 [bacterium]